jgi:hypothetical protein
MAVDIFYHQLRRLNMMKKALFVLSAAAMVLAGCGSAPQQGRTELKLGSSDFRSDRNGILKINNYASFDVAVFAGKVERGNFIGAIKARGSRDFDLSKIPDIPQKGAFLFRAASYEKLSKNGKVGITEDNVIYAGLVSYDLGRPDRKIEQDIFANVDETEETFIYVSNITKYVLELRVDSPDGEKVGVLSPGQRNKKLWIKPQKDGLPYRFFPTYVYIDVNTGELDAFTDHVNKNGQRFEPRGQGPNIRVIEFKGPGQELGGTKEYNVAFVRLQNDTNELLSFETAEGSYWKNTRGTVNTNPGDSDVYELASDTGPEGRTYTNLGVETDSGHVTFRPPITFKPGYNYALIVTSMNGNIQHDVKELGLKSEVEQTRINLFGE